MNMMDIKVGDDVSFTSGLCVLHGTVIGIEGAFARVKVHSQLPSVDGDIKVVQRLSLMPYKDKNIDEKNNTVKKPTKAGTAKDATHYQKAAMQPIEIMQHFLTREEFIGFLKGNIIKYQARAAFKGNRREDEQKALQYAYWLAMAEVGISIIAEHDSVPYDFHMETTFDIKHNYSDAQLVYGGMK